jgi:hypothetical protein
MGNGNALAIANPNRRRLDNLGMFGEGRLRLSIVVAYRISSVNKSNSA